MGRQRNKPQMKNNRILQKNWMQWRQAIYQRVQSNDYKDTQHHEKDIETIKKDQSEIPEINTLEGISEINTLEGINSRLDEAEITSVIWKTR